MLAVYKTG